MNVEIMAKHVRVETRKALEDGPVLATLRRRKTRPAPRSASIKTAQLPVHACHYWSGPDRLRTEATQGKTDSAGSKYAIGEINAYIAIRDELLAEAEQLKTAVQNRRSLTSPTTLWKAASPVRVPPTRPSFFPNRMRFANANVAGISGFGPPIFGNTLNFVPAPGVIRPADPNVLGSRLAEVAFESSLNRIVSNRPLPPPSGQPSACFWLILSFF